MHERTQRDRRRTEITRNARNGLLGKVSIVKPRETTDAEEGNAHMVNVITRSGGKELRNVPILSDPYGTAVVPRKGDVVMVQYLAGKSNAPIVTGVLTSDDRPAPLARGGHWRYEFDQNGSGLYIEAEPDDHSAGVPNVARIATKPGGLSDPTSRIELDNSGSDPILRMGRDTDGDGTDESRVEIDDTGAETEVTVETDGRIIVEDTDGGSITIENGTVDLSGSSIELGDGGSGAIHDIDVTKDTDGHVTDVSLKRRSDVTI